mmetsp:Transcript_19595/g.28387  ORF Transcript_19595/g.28387 Transcript_19595/m.28387 type:complete len:711 (+) Transcript_19595:123-2255(+)
MKNFHPDYQKHRRLCHHRSSNYTSNMSCALVLLLINAIMIHHAVTCFQHSSSSPKATFGLQKRGSVVAVQQLFSKKEDTEEEEEDWRDFRAKLLMQFKQAEKSESSSAAASQIVEDEEEYSDFDRPIGDPTLTAAATTTTTEDEMTASSSTSTKSSSSTSSKSSLNQGWAYDSGKIIEKGSIILSRAAQGFGFGLRQQYFHKCVILVTFHEENTFTKGIILNRPTDLILTDDDFVKDDGITPLDDCNEENAWRMWFGGDVAGMAGHGGQHGSADVDPETICLHSLTSDAADEVSEKVIKDIKWTTLNGARKLLKSGEAKASDFWVFCGYAGWGPGQLMGELERESWYMAATDSNTLLKSLAKQDSELSDPRNAGLDIWQTLMDMIDHGDDYKRLKNTPQAEFDDLMLREWARANLCFQKSSGDDDDKVDDSEKEEKDDSGKAGDFMDDLIKRASSAAKNVDKVEVGTLVRASSSKDYPFLLNDQEFHKSIVLVIQDNEMMSVGVILNLPMTSSGNKIPGKIPCRYGGAYGIKGQVGKPSFWLHLNKSLRDAKIGSPVGDINKEDGIWSCTSEQVETALRAGIAKPTDFMVVSGFSVWGKVGRGEAGGIRGEIWDGDFEIVSKDCVRPVWDTLTTQEELTPENMNKNLDIAETAWMASSSSLEDDDEEEEEEDDKRMVYNSDVSVKSLADDALKCWVGALLLDNPRLRKST